MNDKAQGQNLSNDIIEHLWEYDIWYIYQSDKYNLNVINYRKDIQRYKYTTSWYKCEFEIYWIVSNCPFQQEIL